MLIDLRWPTGAWKDIHVDGLKLQNYQYFFWIKSIGQNSVVFFISFIFISF